MLTQLSGAPSYQNCAILVVLFTYIKIIQIHEFTEIKNVEEILECHEYSASKLGGYTVHHTLQ